MGNILSQARSFILWFANSWNKMNTESHVIHSTYNLFLISTTPNHYFTGLVGILAVPFFEFGEGVLWKGDEAGPWKKLGINFLGGLAIVVWSAVWSIIIFGVLKALKMLRIDRDTEFQVTNCRVKY